MRCGVVSWGNVVHGRCRCALGDINMGDSAACA